MNNILFKLIEGKGKFFLNGRFGERGDSEPGGVRIEGMGFEEVLIDPADLGKPPTMGIRLLPEKPVQEQESQEELWSEAINETVKLDFRQSRIDWLKKHFTINRKNSWKTSIKKKKSGAHVAA